MAAVSRRYLGVAIVILVALSANAFGESVAPVVISLVESAIGWS